MIKLKCISFFPRCIYMFFIFCFPLYIFANPTGENITHGDLLIQREENICTISQRSQKAIINWQDFSIEANEITKILQQRDATILNRVVGDKISKIYGSIEAEGKFYLINQAGILIGPKGSIKSSEVILSTLELSDENYLNSKDFYFQSNNRAKFQNFGKIQAIDSDIFVISKNIENKGDILANKGNVNLIASSDVLILDGKKDIIIKPDLDSSISNEGIPEELQNLVT